MRQLTVQVPNILGAAFLYGCLMATANAAEPFVTTAQGTEYRELRVGSGPVAAPGDVVSMHFVGWREVEGEPRREIYNSRRDRGAPVSFVVGTDKLMPGWSDGVVGMQAGGSRLLRVPPDRAYGAKKVEGIPPGSTMIFLIELLDVRGPTSD